MSIGRTATRVDLLMLPVGGKARFGADAICEDLLECNGRRLSRNYAKELSIVGQMPHVVA